MKNILLLAASAIVGLASAYNNLCNDNIVDYWGQNSYGAANGNDPSGWQQPLRFYCNDDSVDVLPIAFLNTFFGVGGEPQINLANYCNSVDNATFPGTNLANCQNIASDIEYCQSKGKIVTLSLGGAGGSVGFQSDAQASSFADTLWDLFYGGSSNTRPFGAAVLDGIDLDIENGSPSYYVTFLNQLNSHFKSDSKKYYITAAPQCVYPDAALGSTLNGFPFDAVYVQFYNNPCGLQNFNSPSQWNFGIWDIWARTISPNPKVKVYIGAPASSSAAGGGYVPASTLLNISLATRAAFPSFGGVMFWDASQAYKNGRIDAALKAGLKSGENCDGSFTYPACTAPAYQSGSSYSGGSTVSYNGYMWTAKWYASSAPSGNVNGDWSPVNACAGGPGGGGSSSSSSTTTTITKASTTTTTTTTTKISTTTVSASSTTTTSSVPTTTSTKTTTTVSSTTTSSSPIATSSDSCSGVAAWSSTVAYTTGSQVTYNGSLWRNSYWSQADTPGGSAGVWIKIGSCSTLSRRNVEEIPIGIGINCKHNTRWSNRRVFRKGTKVVYKSEIYVASSLTFNQSPESHPSVWTKGSVCAKQISSR